MSKNKSSLTLTVHGKTDLQQEAAYLLMLFGNWQSNSLRVRLIKFLIRTLPAPNPNDAWID